MSRNALNYDGVTLLIHRGLENFIRIEALSEPFAAAGDTKANARFERPKGREPEPIADGTIIDELSEVEFGFWCM